MFLKGEGGCNSFRIPALLSFRGKLLAFAQCNRWGCGDWGEPASPRGNGSVAGQKDGMMKISTSSGRSWGPLTTVLEASAIGGKEACRELAADPHAEFDFASEPVAKCRVGSQAWVDDLDGGQAALFVLAEVDGAKTSGT